MRVLLAVVMAATLAVVTTADRVACVDNCTDDTQHDGPLTATASVCALCHGWNGPATIHVGAPAPLPVTSPPTVVAHERPAHAAPPDHPPKLA